MCFAFHDSQDERYRKPQGAVPSGTKVEIILETEVFSSVKLNIIKFDGDIETDVMVFKEQGEKGCRYSYTIDTSNENGILNYYFTIENDNHKFFYGNNDRCLGGKGRVYNGSPKPYQITVYDEQFIPEWYKEGIIYQIFVDRFYNGNDDGRVNSPKKNSFIYGSWEDDPMYIKNNDGSIARWDFFGGNLKGVIKKLDYLKELGVTIIYLNPIFESFSCHKYDTGDYKKIDPMFGSEDDFKELCAKAEERGMRIILDGVFNHTGANSRYFNKYGEYDSIGAYQSKESPYYKWYTFREFPDKYDAWWGDLNLPAVNEMNPSYIDYIIKDDDAVIAKWLGLGASGWRLDVADELPDEFIGLLKDRMRKEKTDSVLIGEVWEDASNKMSYGKRRKYLFGHELDSVINYPMRNAIIEFINKDITAYECAERIMSLKENYPKDIFYSTMNVLGTHDTERILTMFDGDLKKLEMALMMIMTLPGVPLIYYGDEAGLTGRKDPENRKPYPWGRENADILSLYKKMIKMRKENHVFVGGNLKMKAVNDRILEYIREENNNNIVIAINTSDEDAEIAIQDFIDKKHENINAKNVLIRAKEYAIF